MGIIKIKMFFDGKQYELVVLQEDHLYKKIAICKNSRRLTALNINEPCIHISEVEEVAKTYLTERLEEEDRALSRLPACTKSEIILDLENWRYKKTQEGQWAPLPPRFFVVDLSEEDIDGTKRKIVTIDLMEINKPPQRIYYSSEDSFWGKYEEGKIALGNYVKKHRRTL